MIPARALASSAALLCALVAPARADGRFQVDPTVVELSAAARNGAVIVTNHGTTALRLQATVFAWSEDDRGAELQPTGDLVVRPALLEVPAGASRTVRVGSLVGARALEQSFRLFVEELPDRSAAQPGIRVLTRIGVPVFIAPPERRAVLDVRAQRGAVTVANTGTVRVKLATLELRALARGAARWTHAAPGWYVLPGRERRFAIEVGKDACRAGEQLVAIATDEGGASWTSTPTPCER